MKIKAVMMKVSVMIAPVIAMLALGGPVVANAAAAPIVLDTSGPTASDCGKYTGMTISAINPINTINNAPSGSTVVICPGEYDLSGMGGLIIGVKSKITIKRALTGEGSRPILKIDSAASNGILIHQSTGITIDGLVIDGRGSIINGYSGLSLTETSATVRNSVLIGPDNEQTTAVIIAGGADPRSVSVSNTVIAGYTNSGFYITGNVRVTLSGLHMDGSDGGRTTPDPVQPVGIYARANEGEGEPVLKLGKSRIMNNAAGVWLGGIDKASISGNTLIDNDYGVEIFTGGTLTSANGNTISGNTILGVPLSGAGVHIFFLETGGRTILKTAISKNTIIAAPYTDMLNSAAGVLIEATGPAGTLVTTTVSGNVFYGFPPDRRIYNSGGNTTVTAKGNDALP